MSSPPPSGPEVEQARLDRLRSYGICGPLETVGLESVMELAARTFAAPVALVSLVDRHEVRFVARRGLTAHGVPRDGWFCDHAIRDPGVMVVADAAADQRFAAAATRMDGSGVRFYAGAPILSPDGHALGTVCVIDRAPRADVTADQVAALRALARIAGSELEKLRLAANALEAEQHYREIVETAQEGVGLIDRSGVIEFVNQRLADMLGTAAERMVGRPFTDFLHADGPIQAIENWFAAPKVRTATSVCLRHGDGAPLWVHAGVSPRFDASGAYGGTLAMITDLTSVRLAEERRRETETSFRHLFEMNPNVMWVFDDETLRFLAVNEAAVARFGYSREEFLALTIFDVRPKEEHERLREVRADYDRRTATLNVEGWVFLTRSGERFQGDLTSYTIEFDGRPSRITVIRDVTARKQAEAQLREREATFRYLFDQNPNPMVVAAARSFRVLAGNEAALRLYGYTREEFIGVPANRIRAPEADSRLLPPPPDHGPGVSFARLSLHRRKSGESFPVDVRGSAIMFDGRAAWLTVVHDISEQQRAQASLAEAEGKLRQSQKLEAIGHLTGGIAHDFNNLLTVILGNIELLQDELPPGSSGGELLAVVARAADRGADLTGHLLAFARRQALAPHEVDVNALLGKMHALLARSIGEHIVTNLAPRRNAWPALIDPNQLETAVLNLVVNARDAMPEGGTIDIATANVSIGSDPGQVDASPGDYVVVTVADSGTGMPPDVLAKAFDPFFTTKEPGKGSGLGLSMVYGFVRQSGGHVRLESTSGKGTRVCLYLPRAPSSTTVQAGGDQPVLHARGGGETVLVVEDEPQVRQIAQAHLRSLGYQVLAAGNGAEALDILKSPARIDLMLSDVVMPGGIDGRQLARQALEIRPGLPILLASGYAPDGHDTPDGPGDLPMLHKPYRRGELAMRIRELLDIRDQVSGIRDQNSDA